MGRKLRKNFKVCLSKRHPEEGAALVEFALIAPIFILFIFAILQLGFILIINNALEASVREGARYGITGQVEANGRESNIIARIRKIANDYSGGLVNPNTLIITVKSYPSLLDLESDINAQEGSFGLASNAVKYQVSYQWDTLIPIFGSSRIMTLKAEASVVDEPFE